MISARSTFTPRSSAGQFVQVVITPAVQASVEASGELIKSEAQLLAPVDTGALRDSIMTVVTASDKTITATVGPHVPYANYVEYGTGIRGAESEGAGAGPYNPTWPGMAAEPYLRPAVDHSRDAILDLFRSNISTAVKA